MKRRSATVYYVLSLILEVGTIAAFSLGAWRISSVAWRALVATIVFVTVISLWSAFLMRQAPKRLRMPFLAISVAALASGATAILVFVGFGLFARALALLAVADVSLLVVLWLRHPEFMRKVSSSQSKGSKPARPVNAKAKNKNSDNPRRRTPRRQTAGFGI